MHVMAGAFVRPVKSRVTLLATPPPSKARQLSWNYKRNQSRLGDQSCNCFNLMRQINLWW